MAGSRFPDAGDPKKGAGAFSPKAGWRVPQTKRMVQPGRPHRKRRRSGREQTAFIDPDNLRMVSSRYVPVAALFERQTTATAVMTPELERKMRNAWLKWLAQIAKRSDLAYREQFGKSAFTRGKKVDELLMQIRRYVRGQGPTPPFQRGGDLRRGPARYESLFHERFGGHGPFGPDLTHPPQKLKGVGTGRSASPPRQGSDMLGAGDGDDSRFRTHVPPGSARQKKGDPRYKGKPRVRSRR